MELHKACDHFIIPHSIESHRSDAYYLLATGISHDDHIPSASSPGRGHRSILHWLDALFGIPSSGFAADARCGKFCTQKANKPEAVH